MVDIADGEFRTGAVHPHAFELQVGHGAGGILREGLIHADGDLLPRDQLPGHQVRCQNLLNNILAHKIS